MRNPFRVLGAVGIAALVSVGVWAASVPSFTGPTGSNPLSGSQSELGDFNTLINNINSGGATGINPNTMATFGAIRNFLDNGSMAVVQRSLATSATTAGGTTGCTALTYVADRWCVDTNVGSQQGRGQVITSSPSPQVGFQNSMKIWRNANALTQPVCAIQEIPTTRSTQLAGQNVVLSYNAQALGGLAADNGNVVNAYVIYGTGSDEGLGSMTASPAITPAWTGIASLGGTAQTITTAWVRYQTAALNIPTTATEVGVMLCFTPTATGSGATDGFAFSGVQLEVGNTASAFSWLPYDMELRQAQRYYLEYADAATTRSFPATCTETTANTTSACTWIFPETMRVAPATAVLTATSFGITKTADGTAGACSTLAAISTSNTPQSAGLTCALSQTAAVGTMGRLIGANTGATNTLTFSADF